MLTPHRPEAVAWAQPQRAIATMALRDITGQMKIVGWEGA